MLQNTMRGARENLERSTTKSGLYIAWQTMRSSVEKGIPHRGSGDVVDCAMLARFGERLVTKTSMVSRRLRFLALIY